MAQYIQFITVEPAFGHPSFSIRNKRSGTELGQIGWYPAWKQFTVHFNEMTIWSEDCLADVREFILSLPN